MRVVVLVVLVRPRRNIGPLVIVIFAFARLCDPWQLYCEQSVVSCKGQTIPCHAQHTAAALREAQLLGDQSCPDLCNTASCNLQLNGVLPAAGF